MLPRRWQRSHRTTGNRRLWWRRMLTPNRRKTAWLTRRTPARWMTRTNTSQEKLLSCSGEFLPADSETNGPAVTWSGAEARGVPRRPASPSTRVEVIIRTVSAFRFRVAMRPITTLARGPATVRVHSLHGGYG